MLDIVIEFKNQSRKNEGLARVTAMSIQVIPKKDN